MKIGRLILLVVLAIPAVATLGYFVIIFWDNLGPRVRLLTYNVEVAIALEVDGQAVAARGVTECSVYFGERHSTNLGPYAVKSASDNPHLTLADGTALVFYGLNPCQWDWQPPADSAVRLVEREASGDPLPERRSSIRVAWLSSSRVPGPVEFFESASSSRRLSNVVVIARPTRQPITPTVVRDIPATAQWFASMPIATSGFEVSLATPVYPRMARLRTIAAKPDPRCKGTAIGGVNTTAWVLLDGSNSCLGDDWTEVLMTWRPSLSGFDIDLSRPTGGSSLSAPLSVLQRAGVWMAPFKPRTGGGNYGWSWNICIEGACQKVRMTAKDVNPIYFYNAKTRQLVEFATRLVPNVTINIFR